MEPAATPSATEKKKVVRKTPNWKVWKARDKLTLEDGIALTLNLHPSYFRKLKKDSAKRKNYNSRLKTACLDVFDKLTVINKKPTSQKDAKDCIVSTKEFVSYALKKGWGKELDEFKALGNIKQNKTAPHRVGWKTISVPFITPRMDIAVKAMIEFWSEYDAQNAPSQKVIVAYISKELGEDEQKSSRAAQEIAAMIRPDEVRENDKRSTRGKPTPKTRSNTNPKA